MANLQNTYRRRLGESLIKIFPNYINSYELTSVNRLISGGNVPSFNNEASKEVNSSFGSGSDSNNIGMKMGLGMNTNFNNTNSNLNTYEGLNDDRDDIIRKIKSATIFNEIRFIFNQDAYENFENNLKILKQLYENRVDYLEKNMDYFKSYLENYYRKKIQKTRNNHLDNVDLMNENLPIMNITSEHNEKLKMLRELYDAKLKELEQVKSYKLLTYYNIDLL